MRYPENIHIWEEKYKARARGLLNEHEQQDMENLEIIRQTNQNIDNWIKERFSETK
jgi:hypothetical protein